MIPCNTYYGSYRTRTFADMFTNVETFVNEFKACAFYEQQFSQEALTKIFYLLYARYGNSHIAYTDENQFEYALFSTIWQYAPTWWKRVDIQRQLRELNEEELLKGGKAIYNHSYNPSTQPSTSTLEELLTINDQNTTNYKKSKLEGWSMLLSLLETDVTSEFIDKFRKLFLTVTAPDYPLLYETEVTD